MAGNARPNNFLFCLYILGCLGYPIFFQILLTCVAVLALGGGMFVAFFAIEHLTPGWVAAGPEMPVVPPQDVLRADRDGDPLPDLRIPAAAVRDVPPQPTWPRN